MAEEVWMWNGPKCNWHSDMATREGISEEEFVVILRSERSVPPLSIAAEQSVHYSWYCFSPFLLSFLHHLLFSLNGLSGSLEICHQALSYEKNKIGGKKIGPPPHCGVHFLGFFCQVWVCDHPWAITSLGMHHYTIYLPLLDYPPPKFLSGPNN